ncbi:MAG: transporter [Pirellulales bacterium]|nr:transporter [Pirellulales bacterium]
MSIRWCRWREGTIWDRKTLLHWPGGDGTEGGPPGADEPLASDRPDFVEASTTVGRGCWQLESGYTYVHDDEPGSNLNAHSWPELLLRVGVLADWLELRVGQNFGSDAVVESAARQTLDGADDLYVGVKLGLTPQDGWLPEFALVPQMLLPTGADDRSNHEALPGVNALYGWEINDLLGVGASTQANRVIDSDTGNDYVEFSQAVTINYTLGERLGAYTEWFAFMPHAADTALPEQYADGGFVFRATHNLQFDLRVGLGLNHAADDFFAGTGCVIRFGAR